MSVYQLLLLIFSAAVIVAFGFIGRGAVPWRGVLWVLAGQASYHISVTYWRSAAPSPEAFAFACDFAVVAAILFWGRFRWEMWVWLIFQAQAGVNLVYLASHVYGWPNIEHDVYAILLEFLNYISLIMIGGVMAFQRAGLTNASAFDSRSGVFRYVRGVQRETARD